MFRIEQSTTDLRWSELMLAVVLETVGDLDLDLETEGLGGGGGENHPPLKESSFLSVLLRHFATYYSR